MSNLELRLLQVLATLGLLSLLEPCFFPPKVRERIVIVERREGEKAEDLN